MKNIIRKVFSVLLAVTVVMGLSAVAFAGNSSADYQNQTDMFDFQPGSIYTDSDLFPDLKGLMPGDKLQQKIIINNNATDCDYINVYLRAIPHDEENNPLSKKVAETETIESMTEFLNQMIITLKQGEKVLFTGTAAEAGVAMEGISLGTLKQKESTEIIAELEVSIEMGNEFAYRVGEIDWGFKVEAMDYPIINPGEPQTPETPEDPDDPDDPDNPDNPDVGTGTEDNPPVQEPDDVVDIGDEQTPTTGGDSEDIDTSYTDGSNNGNNDTGDVNGGDSSDNNGNYHNPKTGDENNMLIWIMLMTVAALGGVVTLTKSKKNR